MTTPEELDARTAADAIDSMNSARDFPTHTCPASRHAALIAEGLAGDGYAMLSEDPHHCAETIAAVVESLWKSRARVAELEGLEQAGKVFHDLAVKERNAAWETNSRLEAEQSSLREMLGTARAERNAAEAELTRLRQGVQVKPLTEWGVRELARATGISPTTASRVKSGTGPFDSATMKAVLGATGHCLCCGTDLVSPGDAHPDDLAVNRFAAAMKAKLAKKRADGRGGWEGPDCNDRYLSRLLREHVEKGDPLDVGNLAMMLHQRGERIVSPGDGKAAVYEDLISRLSEFRETWCTAAPGSDEEITLFLLGFDRAVSVVKDAAAPPASEGGV